MGAEEEAKCKHVLILGGVCLCVLKQPKSSPVRPRLMLHVCFISSKACTLSLTQRLFCLFLDGRDEDETEDDVINTLVNISRKHVQSFKIEMGQVVDELVNN